MYVLLPLYKNYLFMSANIIYGFCFSYGKQWEEGLMLNSTAVLDIHNMKPKHDAKRNPVLLDNPRGVNKLRGKKPITSRYAKYNRRKKKALPVPEKKRLPQLSRTPSRSGSRTDPSGSTGARGTQSGSTTPNPARSGTATTFSGMQ